MTRRCRACGRRLRAPTPDGYGPVCRRRHAPAPAPRTAHLFALATEPRPTPDQPTLDDTGETTS